MACDVPLPKAGGRPSSPVPGRLGAALALSFALHVLILAGPWRLDTPPSASRLEVLLAARPKEAPPQTLPLQEAPAVKAIAPRPSRPPLPRPPRREALTRPADTHRAVAPHPAPAPEIGGASLADSAMAMARQVGRLPGNMEAGTANLRRTLVGTRALGAVEAQYVEDWRLKVERVGNLNYPEEARGRLHGSLTMTVELNADGSLRDVTVMRSSGHKALDDAARRIVRLAAPYGAFPPELRQSTDILVLTRTWTFATSDRLRAD